MDINDAIKDFVKNFNEFMNNDDDVCKEFIDSWHNADAMTIKYILTDFIEGMEIQP